MIELSDRQMMIASMLRQTLKGFDFADVYLAMIYTMATAINAGACTPDEAIEAGELIAEDLMELIEQGQGRSRQ